VPLSIADFASLTVAFDSTSGPLNHAADELFSHVGQSARGSSGEVAVTLIAGARGSDGFEVRVESPKVTVAGDSPRGALNGVYWLLEQLGFLWVRPGAEGVRFSTGPALADGTYREAPSFPRRTLILGCDALHDDWRDWLEFASRNRLNSAFFHDTPPSVIRPPGSRRPQSAREIAADGKGWLFERWDDDGRAIRREAAVRGVALQFGGHHLPTLLDRSLFAEHPEWFPSRAGARDPRYNLCTASPGAIAEVKARAREFFARFPGAAVYHLWADDIRGGGWCACSECSGWSPSDQALRATNVLAGVLAEVAPAASLAHLAYHDTIAPPAVTSPAANVCGLYAPRNRNYAFSIDNRDEHYAELLGLAKTFSGRADSLGVFEYYSDAILYKWMDPPNLLVLPADAVGYQRAGVTDFGDLAVTPRPWLGPTWHAWWFARCAWNSHVDRPNELARFCNAAFAADGAAVAGLFQRLDSGFRQLLDLGDLERIPRHDVLDFSDRPREALSRKARQAGQAMEALNGAAAGLTMSPGGLGAGFRDDLAVSLAMANHLAERLQAWDAALRGDTASAFAHLGSARRHLGALNDWDARHSSPAYANLSSKMLQAASWHTERIAALTAG
jgi:hypothetical protein